MSAVRRNAAWLVLSQGATWIVAVVLLLVAPRQLGNDAFGRMSVAMVYVGFFELLALFGTADYLTKIVARQPDDVGRYVANTLRLKLISSMALWIFAVGLAAGVGYDRDMVVLIAIFGAGMVLNVLNNVLMGGLQGLQRMGGPAFWAVIRTYVAAVAGLTVLYMGGGLLAYCLVFNIAGIIPLVANAYYLWRPLCEAGPSDRSVWREVMRGGLPFFVLSMMLAIFTSVDILLVDLFADSETVGWYSLAYRWISLPAFFAAAVATAFFPALAAEGVNVSEAFCRMADRAVQVVVFVAAPCAVGIALIADDFIRLVYGAEFASAVPLMRILAIGFPLVALDMILGTVVISADRQRQWTIYAGVAVVFNIGANMVAIPLADQLFGNAAIGAAVVTVLTEVLLAAALIHLRPAGVFDRRAQALVGRVALASLTMVPVVLLLDSAPVGIGISAGAVTYVVASFLLRTITVGEIREMTTRVGHGLPAEAPEMGMTP